VHFVTQEYRPENEMNVAPEGLQMGTDIALEQRMPTLPTLHETVAALSFALDLTEGAVPGHANRSCLLALRIGKAVGLSKETLDELYYAALLKDVGCSSNSSRMCQIVGGDDRRVKAGAKLADWTKPWKSDTRTLRMLWREVLPGEPAWRKAARMVRMGLMQQRNSRELIEIRCDRGASIVRKIGLGDEVAQAVRHLDEHWDGGGFPGMLRGREIPVLSRVLGVAQHLDAFAAECGTAEAMATLEQRSGRWFDPVLVKAAQALDREGRLWEACRGTDGAAAAHAAVLAVEPQGAADALRPAGLDAICDAFAEVVDAKSPYTYHHSQGVRQAAMAIGTVLELGPEHKQMLSRAALLHDLGKLSVPNSILDKQGKLTESEFKVMKGHSLLSRQILARLGTFEEIAQIAGNHHEKLDGTGYPYGLGAEQLGLDSRLLAVADVYAALSEDRPYREGMSSTEIGAIMQRDVPQKLDPLCYEALQSALQAGLLRPAKDEEKAKRRGESVELDPSAGPVVAGRVGSWSRRVGARLHGPPDAWPLKRAGGSNPVPGELLQEAALALGERANVSAGVPGRPSS
jgi:putative nucleotidyltransferase with HDIG domain